MTNLLAARPPAKRTKPAAKPPIVPQVNMAEYVRVVASGTWADPLMQQPLPGAGQAAQP